MKRKAIRKVSKKQSARLRFYASIAKSYLADHYKCEICLVDDSNQIHHKAGRIGHRLIDPLNFLAVCPGCHLRLHRSPAWARSQGFMIDRLGHD